MSFHPKPPLKYFKGGFLISASIVASLYDRYHVVNVPSPTPEPPYKLAKFLTSQTYLRQLFECKKTIYRILPLQGWDKWPAKTFEKKDIIGFLDYSQGKEDGVGNVTKNKYFGFLRAMFGMLVERGIMEKNPAAGIKQEPIDSHNSSKNAIMPYNQYPNHK